MEWLALPKDQFIANYDKIVEEAKALIGKARVSYFIYVISLFRDVLIMKDKISKIIETTDLEEMRPSEKTQFMRALNSVMESYNKVIATLIYGTRADLDELFREDQKEKFTNEVVSKIIDLTPEERQKLKLLFEKFKKEK